MKKIFLLAAAAFSLFSFQMKGQDFSDRQLLQVGDGIAIANTVYGKIQGFIYKDVCTFLGVPYGASTANENRFMPPQEPEKWDGIRQTLFWGNYAPQRTGPRYRNGYGTFFDHWNYYDCSEDCLNLNVWTPALDCKKRPVLVWIHGGSYTSGNSIEQDGYDGNNISRQGDIVYVSINHRLGAIGFSDLSAFGEKYANSGNAGVLDIVAALRWVHNNISNFGGDPGNVTIMGQSGGGAKVCTVLGMIPSKGLVHKAVALSGNTSRAMPQQYSREIGEYIVKEAGLTAEDVDKLQQMPWDEYQTIANRALQKYMKEFPEKVKSFFRFGFGPVEDGVVIPKGDYFPVNGVSADVPMIISSAMAEASISRTNAELEDMDKAGAVLYATRKYDDKAQAIIDACERAFPEMKPVEWANLVANSYRPSLIISATAKYKQGAPIYNCWFGYESSIMNGRMRAFHCSDICYWLMNTDLMYTHTGGGPEPRAMSDKMSKSLLNFMRTGDPNCGALPYWPKWDPQTRKVLVLKDECVVLENPDQEIIELIK